MDKDAEQLRLLSIAHYVVAGMTALFSCFPIIHVVIGLVVLLSPPQARPGNDPFPPQLFGLLFIGMGTLFILIGWTTALCMAFAGRSLNDRKRYQYCFVVAVICCTFAPLGTVLGVCTLIVLLRPSVQTLFQYTTVVAGSTAEVPFAEPDDGTAVS